MTRLLQIGLIKPEDLHRKYTQELFANEIVLLSYYIAAINIETVYTEVATAADAETGYVPFDGIALTDTFQLNESDGQLEATGIFPENHARVIRQRSQDIRVIVMNPPFPSMFACCALDCCNAAGRDRTQMAATEGSANPSRADFCMAA